MPAVPNGKRIWTPNHSNGTIRARRFPFAPVVRGAYTPPTKLPPPQRTLTELDAASLEELLAKIAAWEEEADRIEFGKKNPNPTLVEQLSQLLCKENLPREYG